MLAGALADGVAAGADVPPELDAAALSAVVFLDFDDFFDDDEVSLAAVDVPDLVASADFVAVAESAPFSVWLDFVDFFAVDDSVVALVSSSSNFFAFEDFFVGDALESSPAVFDCEPELLAVDFLLEVVDEESAAPSLLLLFFLDLPVELVSD